MNTQDILNLYAYPTIPDNTRRKDFNLYDTQAIATGTTSYRFFNSDNLNPFLRNIKLPIPGSEMYQVNSISGYLNTAILTTAQVALLNQLLQQSYLLIMVNNRISAILPGMDFVDYVTTLNGDATPEILVEKYRLRERRLVLPIFLNSTSNVTFDLVMPAAVATGFNGINFRLQLKGFQYDKLNSFWYDELQNKQFQNISYTAYSTLAIPDGNQGTYTFFADTTIPATRQNLTFPMSDIERFDIQAMEVLIGQPDTPIVPYTEFNNSLSKVLTIRTDDILMYQSNLQNTLSVVAGFAGNLTTAGADTLAYAMVTDVRQENILYTPLTIPSLSKVYITIQQPASSLPVTGYITLALRGIINRRVA